MLGYQRAAVGSLQLPFAWRPVVVDDLDARVIALGAVGVSFVVHFAYALVKKTNVHQETGWIRRQGSATIAVFNTARFLACAALVGLSASTAFTCDVKPSLLERFIRCPEQGLLLAYAYATFLALTSLFTDAWTNYFIRHNILVTFPTFLAYVYRDLWPLATYTLQPADAAEGNLLWAKIGLLGFVSVFVPMFIPTKYIPVDPKNPMAHPNPEQTASYVSLFTWTYLDPVVWLGYRVPHLSHTQIPEMCDYDTAPYLRSKNLKHIDPFHGGKNRHIFWSLMRVFSYEYGISTLSTATQAFASLISPFAMNRLLFYLETSGEGATTRPWLWIALLFVGAMSQSILFQIFLFYQTAVMVRVESILTQTTFEHALRIRLKAEVEKGSGNASGSSTPKLLPESETSSLAGDSTESGTTTPDSASVTHLSESTATEVGTSTSREGTETTLRIPKGKSKKKDKGKIEEDKDSDKKDAGNLIGKINNLVTQDLNNITMSTDFILVLVHIPLQMALCIFFLYQILGWSAFVGLGITLFSLPLPGYITKLSQEAQQVKMKKTDSRVQVVTEIVNVIRMIKLFGWEKQMSERLQEKREEELDWLFKTKLYQLANGTIAFFIPMLTMLGTYGVYAGIMKEELTVSRIFSSMSVFLIIQEQLHRISWEVAMVIQGKVSLDRFNNFFKETELLDEFSASSTATTLAQPLFASSSEDSGSEEIGFRNATFTWSAEADSHTDGTLTPRSRTFRLRIHDTLLFKKGKINLIVGPTGSGKTSILMALLGEMHFVPTHPDSWFNLPRTIGSGVAYASQESWVQNQTIRDNILFGSPYDEERYKKVLVQCALEKDMELFEAGDMTEVGERGLTLSGGQKARVTLARAIYSHAGVVLLDDILAALDVHTSAWIVEKCLKGDLVKGRTILLVTHNVALAAPTADFIVSLAIDGTVKSQGTELKDALLKNAPLAAEVKKEVQEEAIAAQDLNPPAEGSTEGQPVEGKKSDGKLVVAEEIKEGHVTSRSIILLLKGLGGDHPILFFASCVSLLLLSEWSNVLQTWFLGYWGSQYEQRGREEVSTPFYLGIYSSILLVNVLLYCAAAIIYNLGIIRATRTIHDQLMDSVFHSTLRWLDETPLARIIARFTQDIRSVDGPVSQNLIWVVECTIGTVTKFGVVILFTPIFFGPSVVIAGAGLFLGNMYLKAQLSMKRETSNARSPLLAHFSAAIHGLVSIRAYKAQEMFKDESLKRLNHYTKVARTSWALNRWIAVRTDILGAVFTVALTVYLTYYKSVGAANTGLSIVMALQLSLFLLYLVRIWNSFEVEANSLERIQGYIEIEHEPKAVESMRPPAAWPTSGHIRVENLSARYAKTSPWVLHNLSFEIKSGERVGIVGRTGSGKSSLTLALLRCILTEGKFFYDGLAVDTINLEDLRSHITIIPQTPELLSGTLRENLDPFDQHDDATLNDALHAAGLFSLQEDMDEGRITLESKISGGGTNLSVGQRQILALARAMVRGSKLLILDEATSAIDYKTDSVIQSTLRRRLPSDVTVITIAHRLQTIMDADKILVLDSGRIAEFDSPQNLLKNDKGLLRALVDGSGDRDALVAMAEGSDS